MQWVQRNAWRGLLTIAVLIGLVGVWPLLVGIAEDPSVPLGLTGRPLSELAAESPDGFRLADFVARGSGLGLIVNGALLAAIAVSAFRLRQRWAWWAMWALPIWCLTVVGLVLANGVSPGQAPPWPMFSGSVFGVFSAALLLASAPWFFGATRPIDSGDGAREAGDRVRPQSRRRSMSFTTATGIALILSTLIYHGGLAYLFARAQFGDVLPLPRGEKLLIIARHPDAYRWGCRIILAGWIVGAMASVMFAALLRDAGDPIISTVAAALFLMAIVSAVVFWVFHVAPTLSAAKEMARTSKMPAYYEILQESAESSLGVYQLLGLLATAGFGWALLQTSLLPSWVGWVTLGWGAVWAGVFLKTSNGFPLLPMVMQLVIGIALLLN